MEVGELWFCHQIGWQQLFDWEVMGRGEGTFNDKRNFNGSDRMKLWIKNFRTVGAKAKFD